MLYLSLVDLSQVAQSLIKKQLLEQNHSVCVVDPYYLSEQYLHVEYLYSNFAQNTFAALNVRVQQHLAQIADSLLDLAFFLLDFSFPVCRAPYYGPAFYSE